MGSRNRNIYRALILLAFLALNGLLLLGLGAAWSYMNSGADRSAIFHSVQEIESSYTPEFRWVSTENPGRPLNKQVLQDIKKDYLTGWNSRNKALANNDTYGIEDYHTERVQANFDQVITRNREQGINIRRTSLAHNATVDFFSADGKMIVFTDRDVSVHQHVYEGETLIAQTQYTAYYQVLMLLEDGFWRIRQLVEIEPEPGISEKAKPSTALYLRPISTVKGINYYPQASPWDLFGESYDAKVISADFKKISEMGLNTIRIFIPYEEFGGDLDPIKLTKIRILLSTAQRHDLGVILTLFDFYGNYDIADWTLTQRHAKTWVNVLKDHPAIFAWDIKNEPDLDFESRGRERVVSWLDMMIGVVRETDQVNPVTIGWSDPEPAHILENKVDFVSFHYYRDPANFSEAVHELRGNTSKKIMLQEFGSSSYGGVWRAFMGSEKDQAEVAREILDQCETLELPFIFWTLYDFDDVPARVAGSLPWRRQPQRYFGSIDTDGNPKAVFPVLLKATKKGE